jgi:hypothetical protein
MPDFFRGKAWATDNIPPKEGRAAMQAHIQSIGSWDLVRPDLLATIAYLKSLYNNTEISIGVRASFLSSFLPPSFLSPTILLCIHACAAGSGAWILADTRLYIYIGLWLLFRWQETRPGCCSRRGVVQRRCARASDESGAGRWRAFQRAGGADPERRRGCEGHGCDLGDVGEERAVEGEVCEEGFCEFLRFRLCFFTKGGLWIWHWSKRTGRKAQAVKVKAGLTVNN